MLKYLPLLLFIISCQKKNIKIDKRSFAETCKTQKKGSKYFVEFQAIADSFVRTKTNQIQHYYHKLVNQNDFYGQFLIAKNGKILFEDYQGYAYVEKEEKNSQNKPLHIASVSKVLTATLIMRLVQEKKIDIDAKVSQYLPNFYFDDITVRMLLNHRSGLRHYGYFIERDVKWDKSKRITNQDILDLLNSGKVHLETKPGTRFAYCNTNYVLLALIIEKVTGLNYHEAMKKNIFEPLGMNNTFVFDYEKHKDTVSQTYKSTKLRLAFDHLDLVYGDKNIYSTVRDLLKFDLATYSNKFLSKKIKSEMFKGYSYETKGERNYGLGIRLREWKEAPALTYHNGWWHGNTSSYVTMKNDSLTIIALSNKFTHQTYRTRRFLALFGNYPVKLELEENVTEGANE